MPVNDLAGFGADAALIGQLYAALKVRGAARIAVAVSGGSDSMACLHLAHRLAMQSGWTLQAVTVDHALREGAAEEAAAVGRYCQTLGIAHTVLRWDHGEIAGNLQDQARRARYGLMAGWAAAQGIEAVLLGHTADDNAETFMMGLARGAGLDGLTGMRQGWMQGDVRFVRPLLGAKRLELRECLTRHGIFWADDPSNDNDRFARVRVRKALKALVPLGIDADALGAVIGNLAQVQAAMRATTAGLAQTLCRDEAGVVVFDRNAFAAAPDEFGRRLLVTALRWVSGAAYAPRADAVHRVQLALAQGKDATLAGCRIRVGAERFRVVREPHAVEGLTAAPGQIWDGRWQVDGPFVAGQQIRAMGAAGLRQCKGWRKTGHSRDALVVSPAIWQDDVLIAAPLAGFGTGFSARIVAPFTEFVLSH